jgi:hypothetical protein
MEAGRDRLCGKHARLDEETDASRSLHVDNRVHRLAEERTFHAPQHRSMIIFPTIHDRLQSDRTQMVYAHKRFWTGFVAFHDIQGVALLAPSNNVV